MKKTIILSLFIVLSFPLFSSDIIGRGSGSTREEALQHSRESLLTSIEMNISTETQVSFFDDGTESKAFFESQTTTSSDAVLKGVSESVNRQGNGEWNAVSKIEETAASLYRKSLLESIESIENCQKAIDRGLDAIEEISYLQMQLEQYELYDLYSDILFLLGHGTDEKPGVGKETIQSRFTILFGNIKSPASSDFDSSRAKEELEKAEERYDEIRRTNEQIAKEKEAEVESYMKKLTEKQKDTLRSYQTKAAGRYSALKSAGSGESIEDCAEAYSSARNALETLFRETDAVRRNLDSSDSEILERERKEVFDRAYDPLAEMKNGSPTEYAIAERTRTADRLTLERIDTLNALYRDAYDEFCLSSTSLYSVYKPAAERLKGASFTVSSFDEGTSFIVGRYDASSCSWPFAFSYSILGETVTVNGSIKSEEVRKLWKAASTDWKKDMEYQALVELYDAFFHSEKALLVSSTYRTELVEEEGKLHIALAGYTVTRMDNRVTVSEGESRTEFSLPVSSGDKLTLTLSSLGKDREAAVGNLSSLYGLPEIGSLFERPETEDKESYSFARLTVKEDSIRKFQEMYDSLCEEYNGTKAKVLKEQAGFEDLVGKLERLESLQNILSAFGGEVSAVIEEEYENINTYRGDMLREKLTNLVMHTSKKEDLSSSELEYYNSLEKADKEPEEVVCDEFEDIVTAWNYLMVQRRNIVGTMSYSAGEYTEEEVRKDYEKARKYEKDFLSRSYRIAIPQSDITDVELFVDGIDIENMKLRISLDIFKIRSHIAEIRRPYNVNLSFLEPLREKRYIDIPVTRILGKVPELSSEKEEYYGKAAALAVFLRDNIERISVNICFGVTAETEGLDGPIEEYVPFSVFVYNGKYEVLIANSAIPDFEVDLGSTEGGKYSRDVYDDFPGSYGYHFSYDLCPISKLRDKYGAKKSSSKPQTKEEESKPANFQEYLQSLRFNVYKCEFFKNDGKPFEAYAGLITASKYDKYTFYGVSSKVAVSAQREPICLGLGLGLRAGVKTRDWFNLFEKLNFFFEIGLGGHLSMDTYPPLGWTPTWIAGYFVEVNLFFKAKETVTSGYNYRYDVEKNTYTYVKTGKASIGGVSIEIGMDYMKGRENGKRLRIAVSAAMEPGTSLRFREEEVEKDGYWGSPSGYYYYN